MSIKFHSKDSVFLILSCDCSPFDMQTETVHANVELGPIINRMKQGWSIYQLVIPDHIDLIKIFSPIHDIPKIFTKKMHKIEMDYQSFKSYVKDFKARELIDRFIPASDEDLLNDLNFIDDEITHVKIQMNLMEQKKEISEYNFYYKLLHENTHLMFQLSSKELYNKYIDKIIKIKKEHFHEEFNQKIQKIELMCNM